MDNPVLRIVTQRGDADCCIAVLAMYLDRTYEDVLVAAAQLNTTIHKKGMWTHQIETTAKALGTRSVDGANGTSKPIAAFCH